MAGLCLLAVLVVGLSIVAGASAEPPEIGRCVQFKTSEKPYKGKYTNNGCTLKSETETGKYEWHPGVEKASFTATGGKAVWTEETKDAYFCSSESATGEFSGTREVKNVHLRFTNCESGPFTCTSEGHPGGEVETNALEGRIVWEDEATHKLALDLYAASGEPNFAEFTCGGAFALAWTGSVLVPLAEDKMSATQALKYKGSRGFQSPEFYEEGGSLIRDVLFFNSSGKGFVQSDVSFTSTLTSEEKLEINTVV